MVIKKQVPHHFKILRELDLKPYKVTIGKKFMPKIHTELISQNKLFSKHGKNYLFTNYRMDCSIHVSKSTSTGGGICLL